MGIVHPAGQRVERSGFASTVARAWFRMVAIALLALVATACTKTHEWRVRYVMTVDTPNGEVVATSVVGERLDDRRETLLAGMGNVWFFFLEGEAVVADLGRTRRGPRHLFALVTKSEYLSTSVAARALGLPANRYGEIAESIDTLKDRSPIPLEADDYPQFVTFSDVADPLSIIQVDPENLAETFGSGYRLKSMTMEVTDDPVTSGAVDRVLGASFFETWDRLRKEANWQAPDDPYASSFLRKLGHKAFRRSDR